jgi:hypothetical protein
MLLAAWASHGYVGERARTPRPLAALAPCTPTGPQTPSGPKAPVQPGQRQIDSPAAWEQGKHRDAIG